MTEKKESREVKVKRLVLKMKNEVGRLYKSQLKIGKTPKRLDDINDIMSNFIKKIINFIKKEDSSFQVGENESTGELQLKIISYFREHDIIFAISPIQVTQSGFLLNAPMYKLENSKPLNLSVFELSYDGKSLPKLNQEVELNEASILIPDVRASKYNKMGRMVFDGMTIVNPQTQQEDILVFPRQMERLKDKNTSLEDYQNSVEMHEASQVYFNLLVPMRLLGEKLNKYTGEKDSHLSNTRLIEVKEAFGEWASLKFSKDAAFSKEVSRLSNSKDLQYGFSRIIINAAMDVYRKELGLSSSNNIFENITPENLLLLQNIIVDSFEANLVVAVQSILSKLPKAHLAQITSQVQRIIKK